MDLVSALPLIPAPRDFGFGNPLFPEQLLKENLSMCLSSIPRVLGLLMRTPTTMWESSPSLFCSPATSSTTVLDPSMSKLSRTWAWSLIWPSTFIWSQTQRAMKLTLRSTLSTSPASCGSSETLLCSLLTMTERASAPKTTWRKLWTSRMDSVSK